MQQARSSCFHKRTIRILSQDYKAPAYLVDSIHLNFVLNEDVTRCAR